MPTRQQATIWTNDGLVYLRTHTSLGPNEIPEMVRYGVSFVSSQWGPYLKSVTVISYVIQNRPYYKEVWLYYVYLLLIKTESLQNTSSGGHDTWWPQPGLLFWHHIQIQILYCINIVTVRNLDITLLLIKSTWTQSSHNLQWLNKNGKQWFWSAGNDHQSNMPVDNNRRQVILQIIRPQLYYTWAMEVLKDYTDTW